MKITNKTTVEQALIVLSMIDFIEQMSSHFVPVELPELTYGQRLDLGEMKTLHDLLFLPVQILKGVKQSDVLSLPFCDVYNFGMTVFKELERISKRDSVSFRYEPTPEEVRAGYFELNHGAFGIVDRISQRMHISHDEVFNLPERRVFAMMKLDFDNSMFQRRLQKAYQDKKV